MTTNFRLLAMAAVAMLAMNSCVKEENLNNGDKKGTPVEFEMGVNSVSRTDTPDDGYTTTFVTGDTVGIFVYKDDAPVVQNACYKLNADGKWVAQDKLITVEKNTEYSYYAYYPYKAENTDASSMNFTVSSLQTESYTDNDVLIANSGKIAAGTTTVQLQYSHSFALVEVNLKGALVTKGATVTLRNIQRAAAINLITGEVGTASGTPGIVEMKASSKNAEDAPFSYRAIVPAQTITSGIDLMTIYSYGKNYKITYNKDVAYEKGKLRHYDVTLGAENESIVEITDGTIANWEASSPIEGGESKFDEIGPTYINYFGNALTDVIGNPTFAEDTWYGLKRKADEPGNITYAIEEDEATTWGKAAKFSYTSTWNAETKKAVNNSWYLGTLGYYHCSADAPINGGIYKVSMKIKGIKDNTSTEEKPVYSKLVFTCRNADNSSSFGASASQTFTATTVTSALESEEWEEFTIYINFDKKSTSVGTVPTTGIGVGESNYEKRWIDSEESDYSKFDLRIYTNNPATATVTSNTATIYISDLKMEPYVAG